MDDNLYNGILLFLTTISILLQCYVIFMVIRASPKSMSAYRYFLCLISVWDLIFTILLGYGLHPKLLFPLSAGKINGFLRYFGLIGAKVGLCAIIFAAVNVFAAQLYCLLYRLAVVLPDQRIYEYIMKPTSIVLAELFSLGIALAYGIPVYEVLLSGEALTLYVEGVSAYFNITAPPADSVVLAMDFNPEIKVNSPIPYCEAMVIGFVLVELLCFVMAYFIIKILRKNVHLYSKHTYRIQIQLTVLLIVQLASPIIFFMAPVIYALLSGLLGSAITTSGDIGIIFLCLYALSNSLLTVLFITPYRRTLKHGSQSAQNAVQYERIMSNDRCIIGDVIQSLNESLFEIDKCSQLKNFTGKLEECFPEETRQEFQSDADQRIGAMCKDKLRRPTSLSEPMKCRVEVVMRWLSEILRDVDLCRSLHYGLVDLKQCPDHKDVRFVRRIWEALIDDYCLIDE
ncbi:serpentine type 7TM GPCR chemoreceptor srh domain-containing protein [Ditylenchus destructor]|uniref:Serpentine type 7TM GPCR chemoreceptor srh domain-containing protein n=1 Tax=Ditylenchus destructor TaxID=166010 RepID=A0AAD4QY89_9BILA|nr:serpentine type 7TM GPCR chemoreceptor srh domain-containing protein [Ditylenchus destructor]